MGNYFVEQAFGELPFSIVQTIMNTTTGDVIKVTSTANLVPNMPITGFGIPDGTKIKTIIDLNTIQLTTNVTLSPTSRLTFTEVVAEGGIIPGVFTRYTVGDGYSTTALAYGANTFVGVMSTGKANILSSPDGITWTKRTISNTLGKNDIIWDQVLGQFITVGQSGIVMTSTDGITWTTRTSNTTSTLHRIKKENNSYCIVGDSGTFLRSDDGITWTKRSTGSAHNYSIASKSDLFVVVGGVIATSPDGDSWTVRVPQTVYRRDIQRIRNMFVVIADGGEIHTSLDGITWTKQTTNITTALYGLAYNDVIIVTVGASGKILTSIDGTTWTQQASGTTATFRTVIWTGEVFLAGGDSGVLRMSYDGITWTALTSNAQGTIDSIVYNQNILVINSVGYGQICSAPAID